MEANVRDVYSDGRTEEKDRRRKIKWRQKLIHGRQRLNPNGIDEGASENVTAVLETTVLAALLMTFSVTLLVCPPDAIAELEHHDWKKVLHSIGWAVMTSVGAGMIVYARLYTGAVSRAVRASDKLRIQMRGNPHQITVYMLVIMFVFFGLGTTADCAALYGTLLGTLIGIFCFYIVLWFAYMALPFLKEGHLQFGWTANRKARNDPMDDRLLFELLRQRAEYSKYLRNEAESIFYYPRREAKTNICGGRGNVFGQIGPACLSKTGENFLNEFRSEERGTNKKQSNTLV